MSRGINTQRNAIHDAAGINDDYPIGKGIFRDESDRFIILVNFEDHIEIIIFPGQENNLLLSIEHLNKLNKAFDKIFPTKLGLYLFGQHFKSLKINVDFKV